MATDEEYLDSLLKSIADGKKRPGKAKSPSDERVETAEKKVDDMQGDSSEQEKDTVLSGQNGLEGTAPARTDAGPGEPGNDSDEWEINIDQLLEQADMLVSNDMLPPMPGFESADAGREAGSMTFSEPVQKNVQTDIPDSKTQEMDQVDNNMSETFSQGMENAGVQTDAGLSADPNPDSFSDMDSDLDEINSLLQQADLNEKVDEDMLALLESATDIQDDDENLDEVFDIFADADTPVDGRQEDAPPKPKEEKAESEDKKGSQKKKKKKEKGKKAASKEGGEDDGKEKKPGLLAKIKEMFAQKDDLEEEDGDSESGADAKQLNDLNKAEGKKASKPAKKDKKKEKAKGGKNAKETKPKKAKPPKPKKAPARKKEEPKPRTTEKPVKILNGKSFVAILGLCLSVIAGVMIVTTFLPAYANSRNARMAYRDGDYKTVYRLLYDKKISGEDEQLYNQSRTILQLERRLSSYQNNVTLGRELEAVDALMMGVWSYQDLPEADTYNVRGQVDALYQQICSILESNYGVTREQAIALNGYDEIEYTRALYSIVGGNGTGTASGQDVSDAAPSTETVTDAGQEDDTASQEPEDALAGQEEDGSMEGQEGAETGSEDETASEELPEDVLPEEEDILN